MNEIFHRVSVRKFEPKPVEQEKILQILRAAMQAPSTGDQRPWEFYVVTNREKIVALSKCHKYAGCAANAPVLIVPVYRKEGVWLPEYEQIDMAIAQENIWMVLAIALMFSIFLSSSMIFFPNPIRRAMAMLI